MNLKRSFFTLVVALLLASASAFACAPCPTGQQDNGSGKCVPIPKPKPCPKPTPPPAPKPTPTPTPQPISITNNNGSSSNSGASSTSTSGSSSNSGATATGGNATGGNVSNSGNSSNTNNNTANGGQGGQGGTSNATGGNQKQSQSSTSSANGNGNGNGDGSNNTTTNVAAPKIPVNTAFAPIAPPTVPCFKGASGGVQFPAVGVSGSAGKIDAGCDDREQARTFMLMGARTAACKVLVYGKKNQQVAKKHPEQAVTMDDCMYEPTVPPVAEAPAPPPASVQIIMPANTPVAAVAPAPLAPPEYNTEITVTPEQLIGICTFAKALSCKPEGGPAVITVSSVCKQMLDAAHLALKRNPNSVLIVRGNYNPSETEVTAASRANNVKKQLIANGVPSSRVKASVGGSNARTVELILVPKN